MMRNCQRRMHSKKAIAQKVKITPKGWKFSYPLSLRDSDKFFNYLKHLKEVKT
jgi:hypothetical protein